MRATKETHDNSTHDLKSLVREGQHVLKSGAQMLTEEAQTKLRAALDAAEALRDKAQEGIKATDRAVREYPYQSLGIAVGVGVLIGWFLRRR